jgi:hypothetical protein
MAIDKTIYNNGIKGNLSYWEIESLPRDYEFLKGMFKEATEIKEGKRTTFSTFHVYEPDQPKKMNKLQEELRMMQVISRATYGMNNTEFVKKTNAYGTEYDDVIVNKSWFRKLLFWLNPKRLWAMWKLKQDFKKLWGEDRKRYNEAAKELKAYRKEMEKKRKPFRYNVDSGNWKPIPSC